MIHDILKRPGKFKITGPCLSKHEDVLGLLQVMARCIVTRCEYVHHLQVFEYIAYSFDFDEIEEGKPIPEYQWTFVRSGPATVDTRAQRVFE